MHGIMVEWNWTAFCGSENFSIWNKEERRFGNCFEKLCLTVASHILLALVSSFHFSRHHSRRLRGDIPTSHTLNLRFFICIFLAVLPCILLVISFSFNKAEVTILDILSCITQIGSWIIHSGFIWRLRRYYHLHIRGPVSIVLAFLTTTVAIAFHLYNIIIDAKQKHDYFGLVEEYGAYMKSVFHLMYLLTLIPSKRPHIANLQSAGTINYTDSERQPLLQTQQPFTTCQEDDLGPAGKTSNCLSHLFLWWANPLMKKGYHQKIKSADDCFDLPSKLKTDYIQNKFHKVLTSVQNACRNVSHHPEDTSSGPEPTSDSDIQFSHSKRNHSTKTNPLLRALAKAFGVECFLLGILKFFGDSLNFAGPILLNLLVSYMENSSEPTWHGYVYASALFLSTFLSSMFGIHFNYRISLLGLKVRAALITSVYSKALSVNTVSLSAFSTGEVVNFMSTDTDRIVNFAPSFHQFWSLPLQVGVALYLLYSQVGLAFLAGLGFAILLIPINRAIAIKIGKLSTDMMAHKDSRVKIMNEALFGIRVIKFSTWEDHFKAKVNKLRLLELASLKGRKYLDALCVFFWATTPVLISILTFTTYALLGHQLTAAKVFTSIALFNILITPLNAFPWVINGLMESWVSIKRQQKYLSLTELDLSTYYSQSGVRKTTDIHIDKGVFSWSKTANPKINSRDTSHTEEPETAEPERTLVLRDIGLQIPKGSITGVVGKVGSGKTSLLHAILAEMNKHGGTIAVSCLEEGFGLSTQEAWIQHATVRENILFGRSYDSDKYDAVIDACALKDDLKILPAGDQTEIGENGVTLSGGQKARVALARAVYQDKSVYLLDDPFAAVDTHVANHLYNQCISGLLKGKTVVLCTHHTKFLHGADHVIVIGDGHIIRQGTPSEVLTAEDPDIGDKERSDEEDTEEEKVEENKEQCTLVEEEEKHTGVVKFQVYVAYWRAVGRCLATMVLIFLFLMQASKNVSDWWLSYWVTHSHTSAQNFTPKSFTSHTVGHAGLLNTTQVPWSNIHYGDDNTAFYLTVYGSIAGSNAVFALARAFSFAYGGVCAATRIHKQLLSSIFKAPIKFFDVTPIGRILNRFSSDLYAVDDSLPFILNIFLAQIYGLLGTVAVTCVGLPWFLVLLVPLSVIYFFVQKYYRHTSREVKRIMSVTLSPIYAHFSETVTGLVTIRAHREQTRFEDINRMRLEENQRAQLSSQIASVWFSIRLQFIGIIMVTGVAFIAVLEHHFQTANPGLVGLAISYALSVTGGMSGAVQFFTETEQQMVSVERTEQYIHDVPHEMDHPLMDPPSHWPFEGAIKFRNVKLQYRPGLPFALNGVSFQVMKGEKIGIVGRTGSGKSSLFLSLFRMVEIYTGEIEIDGFNVALLPLSDLRCKMAVIPQDPFMFSGTIRENLDPLHIQSDSALWLALSRCHLQTVVERLGGLDAEVEERGKHFSLGQRQLLCLARALLTKAKILCIDEATASVDRETDEKLQVIIRTEFEQNTVLTIAHRISTVQNCDRVLVMDNGRVAEFDKPSQLLQNTQSLFYGLVNNVK